MNAAPVEHMLRIENAWPPGWPSLLIPSDQLTQLTGYTQPAKQVEELRRQGFWRARRQPATGAVVLERAHYDAVCSGNFSSARREPEARLRP